MKNEIANPLKIARNRSVRNCAGSTLFRPPFTAVPVLFLARPPRQVPEDQNDRSDPAVDGQLVIGRPTSAVQERNRRQIGDHSNGLNSIITLLRDISE